MGSRNGLTEAQEERLDLLIEEAAEVILNAQKIKRFGYWSSHPKYGNVPNKILLEQELGDLLTAINLLKVNFDVDHYALVNAANDKNIRMREFLFYQFQFPEQVTL